MSDLRPDQIPARIKNYSEVPSQSQYMTLNEASRSQEVSEDTLENTFQSASQISQYAPLHPTTRSWEVSRQQVTIEKIIGKGAFGQVAKGTTIGLRGKPQKTLVAIKILKGVIHFVKTFEINSMKLILLKSISCDIVFRFFDVSAFWVHSLKTM